METALIIFEKNHNGWKNTAKSENKLPE